MCNSRLSEVCLLYFTCWKTLTVYQREMLLLCRLLAIKLYLSLHLKKVWVPS